MARKNAATGRATLGDRPGSNSHVTATMPAPYTAATVPRQIDFAPETLHKHFKVTPSDLPPPRKLPELVSKNFKWVKNQKVEFILEEAGLGFHDELLPARNFSYVTTAATQVRITDGPILAGMLAQMFHALRTGPYPLDYVLVWRGMILDGRHRHGFALLAGIVDMHCYVIDDDADPATVRAIEILINNLIHGSRVPEADVDVRFIDAVRDHRKDPTMYPHLAKMYKRDLPEVQRLVERLDFQDEIYPEWTGIRGIPDTHLVQLFLLNNQPSAIAIGRACFPKGVKPLVPAEIFAQIVATYKAQNTSDETRRRKAVEMAITTIHVNAALRPTRVRVQQGGRSTTNHFSDGTLLHKHAQSLNNHLLQKIGDADLDGLPDLVASNSVEETRTLLQDLEQHIHDLLQR